MNPPPPPQSPAHATTVVDYTTQLALPFPYESIMDIGVYTAVAPEYYSPQPLRAYGSLSPYLDASSSSHATDISTTFYDYETQLLAQDMEGTVEHLDMMSSSPESSPNQPTNSLPGHDYRYISNELRSADKWLRCSKINGKRVYKCLWESCCKEPFGRRVRARIHVLTHLKVKLFECTCGKQFTTRSAVKRHIDSHIASFSCAVCHRYFTRKYNRNLHEKQCTLHALP